MTTEREILPLAGAEYVVGFDFDGIEWRAECPAMDCGGTGPTRDAARAEVAKRILKRRIDEELGRAQMDALIKATGAKWKFKGYARGRGAHKVRRD